MIYSKYNINNTVMDKFPDGFTRQACMTLMENNQNELLKIIRQSFYDIISEGINKCEREIVVVFPDKLWYEHRRTITEELLMRFGKLRVKIINPQCEVTRLISDASDIPDNVKKIIIEFWKDD